LSLAKRARRWLGKLRKRNDIVEFVKLMLGEQAARIFEELYKIGDEVNDEEIAKRLGLKLNEVRRQLYLLSEQGLVSYRRTKGRNGEWYTYYWKIERDRLLGIIKSRKLITLSKLKERLKYEETNTFYICPNCGIRFTFDEALENGFRCPRCGTSLEFFDNTEIIGFLRRKIRELEKIVSNEERKRK